MARSRNIKPGFFTHEQMADNSPLGRLLFLGLTTIADFKGDVEWRPKRIKIQILPYDECSIEKLAINLDRSGFIRFYSDGDKTYLRVVNFDKHQNPHKNEREAGSDIPAYTAEMRQLIDLQTLAIKSEIIAINPEQDGTAPADSLIPYPLSLNPITDPTDRAATEVGDGSTSGISEKQKPKTKSIGLDEFIEQCRNAGVDAIPEDDVIFDYADRIGLPDGFLDLAWLWFKRRYADKKQTGIRGWRQSFRNAVEGNWPKYWFQSDSGEWLLTTAGKQAQIDAQTQNQARGTA